MPSSPSHHHSFLLLSVFVLLLASVVRATFTVTSLTQCEDAALYESAAAEFRSWEATALFTSQLGAFENIPCSGPGCSWRVDVPAGAPIDICSLVSGDCFNGTVAPGSDTSCIANNPGVLNPGAIYAMASSLSSAAAASTAQSSATKTSAGPSTTSSPPPPPANASGGSSATVPPASASPSSSSDSSGPSSDQSKAVPIIVGILGGGVALALLGFLLLRLRRMQQQRARQARLARAVYSPYFLPPESSRGSTMTEVTGSASRRSAALSHETRASRRVSWRREGVSVVDVSIDVTDADHTPPKLLPPPPALTFSREPDEKSAESYAALGMSSPSPKERDGNPFLDLPSRFSSSTQASSGRTTPDGLWVDTDARGPRSYAILGGGGALTPVTPNAPPPPSAVSPCPSPSRGRRVPAPVWRASQPQ